MQNDINNYDNSFERCVYEHCKTNNTGVILIATNSNRSCQISIEKGEIVAASLGRTNGYKVGKELLDDGIKRASFTPNLKFPHAEEAFIDSSEKFIDILKEIPHLRLVSNNGVTLS